MNAPHPKPLPSDLAELDAWSAEYAALRRDLHRHPETAFEERRTAGVVADHLRRYGLKVHEGLARTGVVGILEGTGSRAPATDDSIGLRADMDALALEEQNEFAHRSLHAGKMHGCGHDGHTTMLLAAARYLAAHRDTFAGRACFVFQPAEENEGGGRVMVEEGLFERFPVRAIYGMHNMPGIPVGRFAVKAGAMMAGFDVFDIEIRGVGGHAAMPQHVRDALVAGAQLVGALQTIPSRNVNPMSPVVLSVTQFHAGATYNVLPELATLAGTVRYFDRDVQAVVEKRVRELCAATGPAYGVHIDLRYEQRYPPTVNTTAETAHSARVLTQLVGETQVDGAPEPLMAAEDFAWMLERRPGSYVWIGNGHAAEHGATGSCMVHNPRYDFNDAIIPLGAAYWVRLVQDQLPTR